MQLKRINQLFPFPKLFKLLTVSSVILQLIIISYNHLSGFYEVSGLGDLLIRVVYSSIFTIIAAFLVAYPDLFIIDYLNKKIPWNKNAFRRVFLQLPLTIVVAVVLSVMISLLSHAVNNYQESLQRVFAFNALIFTVVNIFLVTGLEAWIFFNEGKHARLKAEELEQELSQIKFEVLKSQINPHFMFNSLNVLSGLMEEDIAKAQDFIDEFSAIYRYVLDSIEKNVVQLEDELHFVRSYMFLQQIRYGESLQFSVEIPAKSLKAFLPPLSLQTILENAIKHNIITEQQKLKIEIFQCSEHLCIKNNVQAKRSSGYSSGLGQENLSKRYELIGTELPEFTMKNEEYIVKLPLIYDE